MGNALKYSNKEMILEKIIAIKDDFIKANSFGFLFNITQNNYLIIPENINSEFAHIFYLTKLYWKDGDASYDDMQNLYSLCFEMGYSPMNTSKLIRTIIIGIHQNKSVSEIHDLSKNFLL